MLQKCQGGGLKNLMEGEGGEYDKNLKTIKNITKYDKNKKL